MNLTYDALIEKLNGAPFTIHFISIGCAANLTFAMNTDAKVNHQFPPFLQNINMSHPTIPINIILIDPVLENPPNCIRSKNISLNKFAEGWVADKIFKNVYHEKKSSMTVYTFNNYVTNITENSNETRDALDITNFLNKYNEVCMKNNDILFMHDFSGKLISKLAFYYDKKLDGYLNRIMYDIGLRLDGGCYMDLTDPLNMPIIQKNKKGTFEIFNPYAFKDHQLIKIYKTITKDDSHAIIREQIKKCICNKFKHLKDDVVSLYRRVLTMYNATVHENKEVKIIINDDEVDHINLIYGIKFNELLNNKKELVALLYNIIIDEMSKLLQIMYDKQISDIKIKKFVTEFTAIKNPYKIIDFMNDEFKKNIMEVLGEIL